MVAYNGSLPNGRESWQWATHVEGNVTSLRFAAPYEGTARRTETITSAKTTRATRLDR